MSARNLLLAVCLVCTAMLAVAAAADQRLPDAAQRGDIPTVRSLLQEKAEVNGTQGDGMTALHWAAENDDLEMARMLIRAGADLGAGTRVGAITPLFLACANGYRAMTELLLEAGADANSVALVGTTALMQAAAAGSVGVVEALLEHGADPHAKEAAREQTALMYAAALDRSAVVRVLARRGADLNATSKVERIGEVLFDEDGNPMPAPSRTGLTRGVGAGTPPPNGAVTGMGGMTALHYAAREGHVDTVRALVESGARINEVSPMDRSSALVIAIANGHYDLGRYLLDHGADPNLATTGGYSPLYATVETRWSPVAWTPTSSTAADGILQQESTYLELMKELLERGADPNARIVNTLWFNPPHHNAAWIETAGSTAFWRAAQATDVDAMKLLVAYGADPKIPSDGNLTPLAVATGVGWAGNFSTNAPDLFMVAIEYLVEEIGIDVNVADATGYTALMGAAWRGDNEMVRYLVDHGARLDVRTELGWSLTDMANGPYLRSSVPVKHPKTVALLRELGAPELIQVDDEEILGIIKRKIEIPEQPQKQPNPR